MILHSSFASFIQVLSGFNLNFIFQLIENSLIIYFSSYLLLELLFFVIFIFEFIRTGQANGRKTKQSKILPQDGITILVPAYNESVSIKNCIEMLLKLEYKYYEIVVINDGSLDDTLQKILSIDEFQKIPVITKSDITTKDITTVYRSKSLSKALTVIDKQNGGKADALNAGLNFAKYPYVCTIDADSILDTHALNYVIHPFKVKHSTMIAGGELAVLNDAEIVDGRLETEKFPGNFWVIFQIIEYIKSFMVSRTGLGKVKSLLIMSGAFSVFSKNLLMASGGFLSEFNKHPNILKYFKSSRHAVCEDLEIVIRMKRFAKENGLGTDIVFLPFSVCWTEVPETITQLSRQRERWQRGLGEALFYHKKIIFDPAYGLLGLFAMPYYLIFEWFSPIVKLSAIFFIFIMLLINMLHGIWLLMLFLSVTFGAALLMSMITVIVEKWSSKRLKVNRQALRYKGLRDWLKLVFFSILSDFSYSYLRVLWQTKGIVKFIKRDKSWNRFPRKGIFKVGTAR